MGHESNCASGSKLHLSCNYVAPFVASGVAVCLHAAKHNIHRVFSVASNGEVRGPQNNMRAIDCEDGSYCCFVVAVDAYNVP